LPGHLVAIAAVDRIGKEALHRDRQQRFEELLAVELDEGGLAGIELLERCFALLRCEPIELLAIGSARPFVGGGDTGREELARRERQLIALLRLPLSERSAAIHLGAAAPGAGKLPVDERDDAALARRRRELIGRDKRIDCRDQEIQLGCREREP